MITENLHRNYQKRLQIIQLSDKGKGFTDKRVLGLLWSECFRLPNLGGNVIGPSLQDL